MSAKASQITGVSIVCWTVCSGADQRKHQSFASLAFMRGIHRWPVGSPHKRPVTRNIFPFDDHRHHDLCLLRFRRARLPADVLWSPEISYLYDHPQYEHSTNSVTPWWYYVDLLGYFVWIQTPPAPGKSSATGWPSLEFLVYTTSVGHRVILLTCRRHSCRIAFLLPRWWGGSCRHCAMCHDERP